MHIKQYLEGYQQVGLSIRSQKLILAHGQYFKTGEPLPPTIPRGWLGECYKNCTDFIIENEDSGYFYCEGYALSYGIPIPHAWLVDAEGKVYEPTWREQGLEYFGIAFNRDFAIQTTLEIGYYGLLDDYRLHTEEYRFANPERFKADEVYHETT